MADYDLNLVCVLFIVCIMNKILNVSGIKDNHLWCPKGDKQCEFIKIHACVAVIYNEEQEKVASFVICFFTENNNAQECATKGGLDYDEVRKCACGDDGTNYCDERNRYTYALGVGSHSQGILGNDGEVIRNPGDFKLNGFTDFKGAVCAKLNECSLGCDCCPS